MLRRLKKKQTLLALHIRPEAKSDATLSRRSVSRSPVSPVSVRALRTDPRPACPPSGPPLSVNSSRSSLSAAAAARGFLGSGVLTGTCWLTPCAQSVRLFDGSSTWFNDLYSFIALWRENENNRDSNWGTTRTLRPFMTYFRFLWFSHQLRQEITDTNPASADLHNYSGSIHDISSDYFSLSLPAFMITWAPHEQNRPVCACQVPQCFALSNNPAGWLQDSSLAPTPPC